jgi:hypothetical protein
MRTSLRLYRVAILLLSAAPSSAAGLDTALRYLEAEVPRWKRENGCHSCHNNGDGARSLFIARSLGFRIDAAALEDTLGWLTAPSAWEPKALARVQFTAALTAALDTELLEDRKPLAEAAALLAADQDGSGCWQVETDGTLGSPATYGAVLATYLARDALASADPEKYRTAIAKADAWLRARKPAAPLDAAGHYLATKDVASLDVLLRSQAANGSWINEPFDTALALIAISKARPSPEITDRIARARAWLLRMQLPPGGWPGTTRPPGGGSYAQHVSTSAWAAIALAMTQSPP